MASAELRHGAAAEVGEDAAAEAVPVGPDDVLVLRGRRLAASERRVFVAFAGHVAAALERARLAEAAAEVEPVKAADRMRTALLATVSHDLRPPIATGRAAVSRLRADDATPGDHLGDRLGDQEREALLATADVSLARLNRLVDNLLDMSRLQAGALALHLRPTAVAELVPVALDTLPETAVPVPVLTEGVRDVPDVLADPPLLERVIANLVANAVRHTPPGGKVRLSASAHAERVELRVVDRGPGLRPEDQDRAFEPFPQPDEADAGDGTEAGTGLGLGLALARGLTEAMGGTLTPEDTPGGGLTMVVSLRSAV
jgi:two-component system, OmpR family, sensor histidine kinase KdpD